MYSHLAVALCSHNSTVIKIKLKAIKMYTYICYMCMDVSHSVYLYVTQIFSSTEPIF